MEEARWGKGFSAGWLIYESFDRKIIFFVSTVINLNRKFYQTRQLHLLFMLTLVRKVMCALKLWFYLQ